MSQVGSENGCRSGTVASSVALPGLNILIFLCEVRMFLLQWCDFPLGTLDACYINWLFQIGYE